MTFGALAFAWNWKSAVVSSACRAAIFFGANLPAGLDAAVAAAKVELVYRLVAAGFYGGLTERFSRWPSRRAATIAALVVVPGLAHTVEYAVHVTAATAHAGWSVLASVAFSVVTTRFNLYAMRRGLLIAGDGRRPLTEDLRAIARLAIGAIRSAAARVPIGAGR